MDRMDWEPTGPAYIIPNGPIPTVVPIEWEPEIPGQFDTPLRVRLERAAAEAAYSITKKLPAPAPVTKPVDWEPEIPGQFDTPLRIRRKRAAADAGFPDTVLDEKSHTPTATVWPIAPIVNYFAPITNLLVTTYIIFNRAFCATVRGATATRNNIQAVARSRPIIEIRRIAADGFESVKRRAINSVTPRPVVPTPEQIVRRPRRVPHPEPPQTQHRRARGLQMTSSQPPSIEPQSASFEAVVEQLLHPQAQAPQPPIDRDALAAEISARFTPLPLPGTRGSLAMAPKSETPSVPLTDKEPNFPSSTDISVTKNSVVKKPASTRYNKTLSAKFGKANVSRRNDAPPKDTLRRLSNKTKLIMNSPQDRWSLPQLSASEMQENVPRSCSTPGTPRRVQFAIDPTNGQPQERYVKFYKESKIGEWASSSPWSESKCRSDLKSNLELLLADDSWLPPLSKPALDHAKTHTPSVVVGEDADHVSLVHDLNSKSDEKRSPDIDGGLDFVENLNNSDGKVVDKVSNSPKGQPLESTKDGDSHSAPRKEDSPNVGLESRLSILAISEYGKQKLARRRKERDAAAAEKKAAEEAAAAKAKAEAEEAKRKAQSHRRMPKEKLVKPLSKEWEAKVRRVLSEDGNTILTTTASGTELRRKDFWTVLGDKQWLNDEIINAYLEWTVEYANEKAGKNGRNTIPKVIAHNSFFYKNIAEKGPQSVSRWMKRKKAEGKKLLEVETVLIPVNNASHWTIIVVSPKERTIEYLDSFSGASKVFVNNTKAWLAAELGKDWHEGEWRVLDTRSAAQLNGFDCGVFTVTNAECVAGGIVTDSYDWTDMAAQRRRIAAVLLNRGFGGEFVPAEDL